MFAKINAKQDTFSAQVPDDPSWRVLEQGHDLPEVQPGGQLIQDGLAASVGYFDACYLLAYDAENGRQGNEDHVIMGTLLRLCPAQPYNLMK